VLAAFVNSTNSTPSVGTGKGQINPTLWSNLVAMTKAFEASVAVELHDNRSKGPGTSSSNYVVSNAQFTDCGGSSYDICYGTQSTAGNPPPELMVGHSLFYADFYTWDTRN
jgi:hypothetical protein